ncbi:MAG TPA: hypothetical protein VGL29_17115 [Blastocatellia bacterium]
MKKLFQLTIVSLAFLTLATFSLAQQPESSKSPLVRLLQSKGIITEQEAAMVSSAATPAQAEQRLADLLLAKGVISRQEYDDTLLALGAGSTPSDESAPRLVPVVAHVGEPTTVKPAPAKTSAKPGAAQAGSQGEMTTQSKIPVKFYGNILLNSTYGSHGSNNIDVPLFAQKRTAPPPQNHQNFTTTLRASRFGLRYESKIFDDAKLTGVFEFDLFGGKPAFANGIDSDIFRLRLAYGRVDWKKDSLEAGQDWTVFSPLNPTTLASYGIPGFSTSGNLWNRIPQIRYEHREGEKSKFIFTTAVLDPNAGDNSGNPASRTIGIGERGSLPAFEMRLGFTAPSHGKESSGGVSAHYSRLIGVPGNATVPSDPVGTTVRSPIDSYGISGDANIWLSSGFRVTGEAFHGRALGIFSGEIAQSSVVIAGRARGITSSGGWVEVHGEAPTGYQGAWKNFSMNGGYGIEDNRDQDLIVGIRKRNQTAMVNGRYNFTSNFATALEYRHVVTDWFREPQSKQKLDLATLSFLFSF